MRSHTFLVTAILVAGCGSRPDAGGPRAMAPSAPPASDAGYAKPESCAGCHGEIYRNYRQTGMGRSFAAARPEKMIEDFSRNTTFHHEASGRFYTMIERDGRYFQRRHQVDAQGRVMNVLEKEIHFVMGSGNHARTYLHRAADGRIFELPLGWYAERGGFWAMSPGYDRPDHPGFRRAIPDDCMFCHNGYPTLPERSRDHGADAAFPETLPEGIDCQRCHGPGRRHVEEAGAGRPKEDVRKLIFNPAALSPERQLELCMQCHLESTSRALPYAIVRFDRKPFSYRPDEPLANYVLHFDYAPGRGPEDHFEIAHAAYRLRKSRCFTRSGGALVCTTCHDPHEAKRGAEAARHHTDICLRCHKTPHLAGAGKPLAAAEAAAGCAGCHMPKRRTDDVVHAVMTDHYIRKRQPQRDLLAPLREVHESEATAYRGEVSLYYPRELSEGADKDLYLATAQVYAGANLNDGIAQLEQAVQRRRPAAPEFYHQLAEAYFRTGSDEAAAAWYRESLTRDPGYLPAIRNLGATLNRLGRFAEAADVLERAPNDAAALNNLGDTLLNQGRAAQAAQTLRRALAIDPESPEALNNLGTALARSGDIADAWQVWRSAIRVKPDFALAHNNLANSLNGAGRWEEARLHFEEALRDASYAVARYNYGTALAERGELDAAERRLTEAVRLDPSLAEAHLNLGNIRAVRGQPQQAVRHFTDALRVRPGFGRARLNLGVALAELGRTPEAIEQFRTAAKDSDEGVRSLAERALQRMR